MKRSRHGAGLIGLVLATGMSVAACGTNGGNAVAAGSSPSSAPVTTVTATLTDFAITLSSNDFTAGDYAFVVKDAGAKPHGLSIEGPGLENATSAVIEPGGPDDTMEVTLKSGTYHLWCPVGKHSEKGMDMTITVK